MKHDKKTQRGTHGVICRGPAPHINVIKGFIHSALLCWIKPKNILPMPRSVLPTPTNMSFRLPVYAATHEQTERDAHSSCFSSHWIEIYNTVAVPFLDSINSIVNNNGSNHYCQYLKERHFFSLQLTTELREIPMEFCTVASSFSLSHCFKCLFAVNSICLIVLLSFSITF